MACRSSRATAREYEFLEAREVVVEPIEVPLESFDKLGADRTMPWNAELPAEFKQIMLHFGQAIAYLRGNRVAGEYEANRTIRLVNRAIGFHAHAVLGCAAAIAEAGRAIVAGACVYLAESISHDATLGSDRDPVKKDACLEARMPP